VPVGFAVTTGAYRRFIEASHLDARLQALREARWAGRVSTGEMATAVQEAFDQALLPDDVRAEIEAAYDRLGRRLHTTALPVAVRSSATLEDAPGASFAGQHASFLGVVGPGALVTACRDCFASLYTERAIAYREQLGLDRRELELAVGVHSLVAWPDCAAAGVMFSIDTETGFPGVVVVDAAPGLGEAVVQGGLTPDEFLVFKAGLGATSRPVLSARVGHKPFKIVAGRRAGTTVTRRTTRPERRNLAITQGEAAQLAGWAVLLEGHYGHAVDVEWAKDGTTGELCITQARPETVQTTRSQTGLVSYTREGEGGRVLAAGSRSAPPSGRPGTGPAARWRRQPARAGRRPGRAGHVPDWLPLMRRSAAVVTDGGGRTSHAAIVSRELGVPAVVGTHDGTSTISDGMTVTVSCCEGSTGIVYEGEVRFRREVLSLEPVTATRTRVMMNLGMPDAAFRWWQLPVDGIGLARIEFIIDQDVKAHPMALLHPERITSETTRQHLRSLTRDYGEPAEFFVSGLSEGIARIAVSQHPRPVIVRLSDFKSNEYAGLLGGRWFEPAEENPMLGLRGASRYYSDRYREAFSLECAALRRVREEMGLRNVAVMVPFCRTVREADLVIEELARNGLRRGEQDLQLYLMCEIPSNVVMAAEFAPRFDGFSIGSNDLTQLVLGVDRDSAELQGLFDERDPAVEEMIRQVIAVAHQHGATVGICGQAPSDHPEFAAFLVGCGIDSISVNPTLSCEPARPWWRLRPATSRVKRGRPVHRVKDLC
jgi:pyruvate,water dikinase